MWNGRFVRISVGCGNKSDLVLSEEIVRLGTVEGARKRTGGNGEGNKVRMLDERTNEGCRETPGSMGDMNEASEMQEANE